MPDSFTVLWSQRRCLLAPRHPQEGSTLDLLFGGPHISEPRFSKFGVRPGDWIYPVRVKAGVLCVLGRMKVKQILSLKAYIEACPEVFSGCERGASEGAALSNWLARRPEKTYLAPTCTDEVVIGEEGTPLRFDRAVPPEMLERIRYRSRKRERGIKSLVDGRVKSALSLQGIYRLSEESAREFESLMLRDEAADWSPVRPGVPLSDGQQVLF